MEIDLSPRQAGKTTRMIEWLKIGRSRILLTHTMREAERLREQYPDLEDCIFSWDQWLKKQHGVSHRVELAVDNADYILQAQVSDDIKRISFNKEGENEDGN